MMMSSSHSRLPGAVVVTHCSGERITILNWLVCLDGGGGDGTNGRVELFARNSIIEALLTGAFNLCTIEWGLAAFCCSRSTSLLAVPYWISSAVRAASLEK